MQTTKTFSAMILAVMAVANVNATDIVNFDFETDASSSFSVFKQGSDSTVNFQYDYSTYVPNAATNGPQSIPVAPSGSGTTGVRMEANNGDATAAADSISIFPTGAAALAQYTLKFDMYMQWNGDVLGGSGSSEFLTFGANADADGNESILTGQTSSANSICYAFCGEGGFTQDYRFTEGGVANNALANYNGANELDAAAAGWQAVFASPSYFKPGSPGRQWTVVELQVTPTQVKLYLTPTGGVRTLVSTLTPATLLTTGSPFVGYADVNTSIAGVPADNFGLIDNLVVSTLLSEVPDWSVY